MNPTIIESKIADERIVTRLSIVYIKKEKHSLNLNLWLSNISNIFLSYAFVRRRKFYRRMPFRQRLNPFPVAKTYDESNSTKLFNN